MADPDTLIKGKIHYFAREKYYHSMQVKKPCLKFLSYIIILYFSGGRRRGYETV